MSIVSLERSKTLRGYGVKLGREGMSRRAIEAMDSWDGSYRSAMVVVGRLKAISQMAAADDYWAEQVDKGFMKELGILPHNPEKEE